jgi:predicted permease
MFGLEPRADVEAELAFHLEMRERELLERGESPERARELARRRFGDYEESRRECVAIDERRRRRIGWEERVSEFKADVTYALRTMIRTPGFTLVALVTLALGIGANSAIFSVVHGVLLESLPYRDPGRLYHVRMLYPDGTAYGGSSAPDFMSVRQDTRAFEQVEAYSTGLLTLTGRGEPRELLSASVSDGLFSLLGVPVGQGRAFVRDEHVPGRGNVAVLAYAFWMRELGGDPSIVGQTLSLAGRPYTVVGILSPSARLPVDAAVTLPIEYSPTFSATAAQGRRSEYLAVLGRARAGLTPREIDADLLRIGKELQEKFPSTNAGLTFNSIALREEIVGDSRLPLLVLQGAVFFVLLAACANVANLLLVRATVRRGELAVRAALGAGRRRLVRQLVTESLVLGVCGGAIGLALAYVATRALVLARPADLPRLDQIGVNLTVVVFTFGLSLFTSIAFGVLPALRATSGALTDRMSDSGRGGGAGRRGAAVRETLVAIQVALAVVLLAGAGLLIRSFVKLTEVDPGFRVEHAMAFRVALQGDAYQTPVQRRSRVADLEARVRALPGVVSVGATTALPLSGINTLVDFQVVGAPPPPPDMNQEIMLAGATRDYFSAIGAPLVAGRWFAEGDGADAPRVAIVNEAARRKWFKGLDALHSRVSMSGTEYAIVGVVGDMRQLAPHEATVAQIFVPYAQRPTRTVQVVVRSAGDPLALGGAIRSELRTIDPALPLAGFTPLDALVTRSVARPRFYTSLLALFAAVALVLAAAGIFGVVSYGVTERAREIGIRMALGARSTEVLRSVTGRTGMSIATGLVVGIPAALATGRAIQGQLFGVALWDPLTFIGVLLVLTASAVAASGLPVRRAIRTDPARALRDG